MLESVLVIIYSNEYLNKKGANVMSQKDTCDIYCYDEAKVNRIQGKMHQRGSIECGSII